MKLALLQNAFQAGVLLGDSAISRSILDSRRLDRAARFKIYFDAYRFRLAEFLSNDYPVLRSFLGDELFGLLVEADRNVKDGWKYIHERVVTRAEAGRKH